jgi:SagB-type dehydrogenase family enzyme
MWSFHDLVFHSKSRQGRSDDLFGAHLLHSDQMAPPPAVDERPGLAITPLVVPDFATVQETDMTLTTAIESRQSVRDYATDPITVDELGELLYRSARLRKLVPLASVGGMVGGDHPYPTGGLAGDLEIYVTAARCAGLEPGSYHYNARAHHLERVNTIDAAEPLLTSARISSGLELEPQVLLTITSRFTRLSWKYESIAYALTLKHVGVMMQTIYLVATSMGLGPCALGSGNADDAARIFGLDWTNESSVGEMLVGRPAHTVVRRTSFDDMTSSHHE